MFTNSILSTFHVNFKMYVINKLSKFYPNEAHLRLIVKIGYWPVTNYLILADSPGVARENKTTTTTTTKNVDNEIIDTLTIGKFSKILFSAVV